MIRHLFEEIGNRLFPHEPVEKTEKLRLEDAQRKLYEHLAAAETHNCNARLHIAQAEMYQQRIKRITQGKSHERIEKS